MKRGGPRNRLMPKRVSHFMQSSLMTSSHVYAIDRRDTRPHVVSSRNESMKAFLIEEAWRMTHQATSFNQTVDCHNALSIEIQTRLNKIHSDIQATTHNKNNQREAKVQSHSPESLLHL